MVSLEHTPFMKYIFFDTFRVVCTFNEIVTQIYGFITTKFIQKENLKFPRLMSYIMHRIEYYV